MISVGESPLHRRDAKTAVGPTVGLPPSRRFALALALGLLIWGAKLVVIDRFGTDMPYWDQWAKEGELILAPWLERGEPWRQVFVPHNEHRIVPTLLLNFGLFVAGGQWDARVQCIVNAALHAGLAAGFFWWVLGRFSMAWALRIGGVLLLACGSPIVWENILNGFQSQFYFLLGFSAMAIAGLLGAPAWSGRWWGGVLMAAAALLSMGSGFLVAIPIAAIAAVRLWQGETKFRENLATLAVAVATLVVGGLLRNSVPWHDTLHARNVLDFVRYAVQCLAWPLYGWPFLAVVIWLPWTMLLVARWRRRIENSPVADFVLALGGFILLQAAAVAYTRSGLGELPAIRYGDVFALGPVLAAMALALLYPAGRHATIAALALGIAVVPAIVLRSLVVWSDDLPYRRTESLAGERNTQWFILTNDYAAIEHAVRPFPVADWFARILRRPAIRQILPASIRAPVTVPGLAAAGPPAPPLDHRATRTISGPGEWRSAVITPTRGWLKFETAGATGDPGVVLELRDAATDQPLTPIVPTRRAGDTWRAAYVPAPDGPFVIHARVDPPDKWIAVSEPIETAAFSYWHWQFAKQGWWILLCGVTVLGLVAVERAGPRQVAAQARAWWREPQPAWWVFILIAIALGLRHPSALHTPQLWAEDGSIFLSHNDTHGLKAFAIPYAGYLHSLPRLIAWAASPLLDPRWWPAFYNWTAFAIAVAIVGRTFSSRLDLPGKPWMALAFFLGPQTGEVLFNITNLQWVTAVGMIQQLLLTRPKTRFERAGDVLWLGLMALTGPFAILFLPLFAARYWRERHADNLIALLVVAGCAAIQAWYLARTGVRFEYQSEPFQLWPTLVVLARRLIIWPVFGARFALTWWPVAVGLAGGAVLLAILVRTLRRDPRRWLRLQLVAALLLLAAASVYRTRPDTWAHDNLYFGDRYFYAPRVLLAWLLILEFAAASRFIAWSAKIICLAAALVHLRPYALPAPPNFDWARHCEPVRQGVAAAIPTLPEGWILEYPGRLVRK